MFIIGHGLEWYYQIQLNPFAAKMKGYDKKKYAFYIFAMCLILTALGLAIWGLQSPASQIIFGTLILMCLIIMAIFNINKIKMITCCKNSDQQNQAQINDERNQII